METVPGFVLLVQGLSATMTAPTFASLTTVLTDWVFARRHTGTRMILAAGAAAEKHFSSYHRLFGAARWSLDVLGLVVFDLIQPFLGSVVMLGLDDMLCRLLTNCDLTSRLVKDAAVWSPARAQTWHERPASQAR